MAGDPARRIERNAADIEAAFEAAPPDLVAEILNGSLHLSPRPARPHTSVASRLGMLLGPPFMFGRGGPGGWIILDEPELHFGARPDKLVPDLAGWKRARLPDSVGGELTPAFYDVVPDWICEILSLSSAAIDRGVKMPIYARDGVQWAWLIDPIEKLIELHRRDGTSWRHESTVRGDAGARVPPFESIELDLALLWAR